MQMKSRGKHGRWRGENFSPRRNRSGHEGYIESGSFGRLVPRFPDEKTLLITERVTAASSGLRL